MRILALSYFDLFYGPKILLKTPKSIVIENELEQITSLMDIYDEGFYIHIFGSFKSANLIFEIPSEYGRGKRELLLISLIIDISTNINFDLSKELLEGFEKEFKKINEAYKAFYIDNKDFQGDEKKLEEIKKLFYSFYETFPTESVVLDRKDAKILIFGLYQAGKTTIINCLKKTIKKNPLPTRHIDISRILINNLSLYIYDTPGQIKLRSLWEPYLKNQDGLVFVLDIADIEKFDYARNIFHKIVSKSEMKNVPILILFNKTDLKEPNIKTLSKIMNLDGLGDRSFKIFPTCGLTGKNIGEAFYWLSQKISNKINPTQKNNLGVLFSIWDDNLGLNTLKLYPQDFFDDPELIAIRCFSISQFIFGGDKFKRTSLTLPLSHLKMKAAVYFDYVYDQNIRGGRLPLSLVIFYTDDIPTGIINQFNIYVFEKFTQIKKFYSNTSRVLKVLEEIHETILEKLKTFKPTVQALRIAELRYQALFKAARDAILIIDRKSGIIVDANEQAEKLLQQPLEDIIGIHSSQIEIEEYSQNFKDQILMQIELANSPPIEMKIRTPHDYFIPVEVNTSEIQIGRQNLIQCILRDITERIQAKKQLISSENKYRHLFQSSPLAIFLIDFNGVIIDCNPAVEELFGHTREELIKKRLFDQKLSIFHPKYILLLGESLKNTIKGETLTFIDIKMKKKDGLSIWTNVYASLVKVNGDIFIQIIANDITERKEAELKLKHTMEALQLSEAKFHDAYDRVNFYKELFANDMSKIFKNIQLSLNHLSDYHNNPKKLDQMGKVLQTVIEHCIEGVDLVSKVQKLSAIEDAKINIKRIDVLSILQKAIEQIQNNFSHKKIKVNIDPNCNEFIIKANDLLLDLFENILINAVKYNENSVVELEIKISNEHNDDITYLKIEIMDNGIRHSDEKRGNFFERNERDTKGVLLGFILADRILNSYGGQIWIEDKVKGDYTKGNNIVILLPKSD